MNDHYWGILDTNPNLDYVVQIAIFFPVAYICLISVLGYKKRKVNSHHEETEYEALVAVAKNAGLWIVGGLLATGIAGGLIHVAG